MDKLELKSSNPLYEEAKDALVAGGSVQILIRGYDVWLVVKQLWTHGELMSAKLADGSSILPSFDSLLSVRLGPDEAD